jgi:hypothetical protein
MIVNLPNRILLAKVERVFVVVGEHIVAALLILLKQKKNYVCSRGPFLTSPLGANFEPRGEVVP